MFLYIIIYTYIQLDIHIYGQIRMDTWLPHLSDFWNHNLCYHIYIYYSHYKFIHALAGLIKSPVPRFGKAAVAAMTCKDGHI